MSEHTKETIWNDGTIIKTHGDVIAQATTEEHARRIVACVNACRGITTEQLEAASHFGIAGAQTTDKLVLIKQRDELCNVLKNLRWASSERDKKNRIRQFDEFMDAADAAIASVKGGAA